MVGINGVSNFLGGSTASDAIVRHIDYVVQMVGPQHVGLGLDTVVDKDEGLKLIRLHPDAWPGYTVDEVSQITFAQPEQLCEISELLLRRRYADQDVRGILGENFARVASQVWQ